MAHQSDLIATDIHEYLRRHERKGLLRFITCGSVDDGKSTLIGRLLHDSRLLFEDQLAAVAADSRRWGTQGQAPDLALLVDGLAAEREQGITIDVAYRFFSTERRKFIVADTPGHEQYTRNMATGASTADLAIILVDARKGLLTQTRRHSIICALLGVRHVVLAVNKMDLMGWSEQVFARLAQEYAAFAARIGLPDAVAIPMSALSGDQVARRGEHMPWYRGPTLMEHLESCEVDDDRVQRQPLRLPVQWVNRPHAEFRGYCGLLAAGVVRPGDRVRVLPSGRETTVARIVAFEGDREQAVAGESVTLTLADELDISRGDVIAAAAAPPQVADQFECHLLWMDEEPMLPGRGYLMKTGACQAGASVTAIRHKLDVNTLQPLPARALRLNEVALCNLELDRAVAFEPYADNRTLGSFILIDRASDRTVGAGMLRAALRRAHNLHPQALDVDAAARARLLGQQPALVWLTGLSGAGKSTIANALVARLHALGRATYLLDGDNLRHGLNRDLGFTDTDRVENIRRAAEVGRLMVDAGLIVVAAFISPFRRERELARSRLPEGRFIEVFVDAPLAVAEARDPKGLYAKARRGELPQFTGIGSPYEPPAAPELHLHSDALGADEAAERILALLRARGVLAPPGAVA